MVAAFYVWGTCGWGSPPGEPPKGFERPLPHPKVLIDSVHYPIITASVPMGNCKAEDVIVVEPDGHATCKIKQNCTGNLPTVERHFPQLLGNRNAIGYDKIRLFVLPHMYAAVYFLSLSYTLLSTDIVCTSTSSLCHGGHPV